MTLSAYAIDYWGDIVRDMTTPAELDRQEALLERELARSEAATAGMRRMLAEVRTKRLAVDLTHNPNLEIRP